MNKEEINKHLEKNGVQLIIGAYGEGTGCEGLVEKKDIQIDGKGSYTKLIGCSYLFKGFPDSRAVEDFTIPKKLIKVALDYVNTWWGKLLVIFIFLFPRFMTRKLVMRFIRSYYEISNSIVSKYLYSPNKYCPAVRETNRALGVVIDEYFGGEERTLVHFLKDSGCKILEIDAAYKWRYQEFCSLVNKERLKKNPLKELKRVFAIYEHREKVMPFKIKAVKGILRLLKLNKFVLKLLVRFLIELDQEEVKLDEADWYFCLGRDSYDFGGMTLEERMVEKARIDKEKGHNIPNIVYKQDSAEIPAGVSLKPKESIKQEENKQKI